MAKNLIDLLEKAAAPLNDSSEEKHLTEFFQGILEDEFPETSESHKLKLVISSADQMIAFCELVKKKAFKDLGYEL